MQYIIEMKVLTSKKKKIGLNTLTNNTNEMQVIKHSNN